jgi:hypothetical protein
MKATELKKTKLVLTKLAADRIEFLKKKQSEFLETDKERWLGYQRQINEVEKITLEYCSLTVKKINKSW